MAEPGAPLAQYVATYKGDRYPCSIEQDTYMAFVHLFADRETPGFNRIEDRRYVQVVDLEECESVVYESEVCTWHDQPCVVLSERPGDVYVEYAGGNAPLAGELGFERIERGVYRRWVPAEQTSGRIRQRTVIATAADG